MERTFSLAPMEARLIEALPDGPGWQFEPKWDGFRCLADRRGAEVDLWSKSGKPLGRYFPEVVALMRRLTGDDFLLDGELVIERAGRLSFDALQLRLHPAESRVRKLAAETPAMFMAFDLLRLDGKALDRSPLRDRRRALEQFIANQREPALLLSPATQEHAQAEAWFTQTGGALDGVVAKRLDDPYHAGERAFVKVKQQRTADCVVGAYRTERVGATMASLLLGLYDDEGRLNHVGFCSSFSASERAAWTPELEVLAGGTGFDGAAPGGPSRWANARSAEWVPLRPEIVVEVGYDQVTSGRFRHGTRFVRRRPDKRPDQCRCEQLDHPLTPAELQQLIGH